MPLTRFKLSAIADGGITTTELEDGTILGVDVADGVISVDKLSATGTKNSTTFLRGDNTFAVVDTDVVADTTPQLGGDLDGNGNTVDLTGNTGSMGLPVGTTAQQPSATAGHIRYDSDDEVVYYSDGTNWYKISSATAILDSVSGSIIEGLATSLTLAGSGFLSTNLVVNFVQASDGIDEDVTVTPTSDTAATVSVPSAVYDNVTSGNAVTIKVTNSDGMESGTVNTTAIGLPTGGTITTSGDYRIHTFTSSGTFTNTISSLSVEYLTVAGGGAGGGSSSGSSAGGGGGAGGMITGTTTMSTGAKTVTIGAGGSGNSSYRGNNGGNTSVTGLTTCIGGGGGGRNNNNPNSQGLSGGSGGGGGAVYGGTTWSPGPIGGSGTSGQGNSGGTGYNSSDVPAQRGGGGGGKGAAGASAPTAGNGGGGGNGSASSISGSSVTYAGGGGGGAWNDGSTVNGGTGGGGNGSYNFGTAGTANRGGGGGGSGGGNPSANREGANGGSGIVILRYDTTAI